MLKSHSICCSNFMANMMENIQEFHEKLNRWLNYLTLKFINGGNLRIEYFGKCYLSFQTKISILICPSQDLGAKNQLFGFLTFHKDPYFTFDKHKTKQFSQLLNFPRKISLSKFMCLVGISFSSFISLATILFW